MTDYRIGEISERLGVSVDTLRYYERIGLLPKVARSASGIRKYDDKELARLQFIRRAQAMNFSLSEIAELLKLREHPEQVRDEIRELTQHKLAEIEARLGELEVLRDELRRLLGLCAASRDSCPIIERFDGGG